MGQTLHRVPAISDILFARLWHTVLEEACREADRRTDSCYKQKSICWQKGSQVSQLPLAPLTSLRAPEEGAMICSDAQVRAGASVPLLPHGWVVTGGPIQASAAAYECERATTHWFLLPLSSSKKNSPFLRSRAACLLAHDPDRAFTMQIFSWGQPLLRNPWKIHLCG